MVPVGRLIVVRNTEKSQLMQAISTITWPAIVAPVVGPPIGGFITTYASWEWIFLLNVPFGIVALAVAFKLVPNERSAEKKPLDIVGFLLSGATLTAILYGTELASQQDANLWFALSCVASGLVLGVITFKHASSRLHPLIDYTTLRVPTYSVTVITGSITRIGIGAVPYLMPLLFQIGFGLSAFHSGLLLLASAVGNLGMKAFTTRILQRWGFRTISIVDVLVAATSTIACGLLTPSTPLLVILLVVFIYGLARSMQFSTLATLAYADIPTHQMSTASSLWSAASQMTIGMGIAFGAVSLQGALWIRGTSGSATGGLFTLEDFKWAFAAAGCVTLLSLPGYWRLARDAGAHVSAQKPKGQS
jgi:MFS family permease